MKTKLLSNDRSSEVNEIMFAVPNLFVRFGISLFFIFILLVLTFSFIIRYPEIIISKITILSEFPPVGIIAQSSGKIIKLIVEDNQYVRKNDHLALIDNTADANDVFGVKSLLDSVKHYISVNNEIPRINLMNNVNLGDLQYDYLNFRQSYFDYIYLIDNNYENKKITTLLKQLDFLNNLKEKYNSLVDIKTKEYETAKRKYANEESLFKKGLISDYDLKNTENDLLEKQQSIKNAETVLISNELQYVEYEKSIMDLEQQYSDKKRTLLNSISTELKKFDNSYSTWEYKYLLKSPVEGKVSFYKYFKENQYININNEVMSVVPLSNEYEAKLLLPVFGSGKVKIGQKILIKLDNYPYQEFGALEGYVNSISLVQRDNNFLVNVTLPNKLQTTYLKSLDYVQDMTGTAEVITEDLSLFQRIFNQLRKIFAN